MKDQGNCTICKEIAAKYKCSKCPATYCSVACFKLHKASNTCQPPKPDNPPQPVEPKKLDIEDEELIADKDLEKLRDSHAVRKLLSNKHLRKMMVDLDKSADHKRLEAAMREEFFVEFADACLSAVGRKQSEN